jgi:GT2 family glycosyltransferase
LSDSLVAVAIPTLAADRRLDECLASLSRQSLSHPSLQSGRGFEVIVIDNSGTGALRSRSTGEGVRVIENPRNLGFGAAINQAMRASRSRYLAVLNDDAVAHSDWLRALVEAMERRPDAGMGASQVRLYGEHRLDSAGMLVAADGSSKQRGHGRPPEDFPVEEEVLFPSGSAAIYRRTMLDQIGGFDDSFFLYCEDTDLGLRARWAGWKCLYVPRAVVEHHYSHSAGGASPVKAYFVERNRLFVLVKNYPVGMLAAAPLAGAMRYFWHLIYLLQGRGSAARFRASGHAGPKMLWYVIRAHVAVVGRWRELWRQRTAIRTASRVTPTVFRRLIESHSIGVRRLAEL